MAKARLKLHARIYCGEEIAMGPGKADLLEAIEREGSISAAGRAMDMSYRRAWLLVDVMNRCWSQPLVDAVAGGGRERGARLSDMGREVLAHYRALQHLIAEANESREFAALEEKVRSLPLPSQRD
ncbi:LysR family transcriptional regulator [Altericroceibacterium spongiae]|uniref:LysR family transcriptional regulator n=1 Tax=Altericroceibacterium spongiae TaxID=2320269 RepID=A0A420EMB4_9SPHN|nr:LysR family transcriptional regulator [Altericroceibacterium spongiae]RKF21818.1 LysR family transcriptional regulator [Altericroceibacterium spongiae]